MLRFLTVVMMGCIVADLAAADDPPRPFGTFSPTAAPAKKTASADPAAGDLGLAGDDLKLFRLHWRAIATHYAQVGENFYCSPQYDLKYLNSTRTDLDAWQKANATTERRVAGSLVREVANTPPREEALVAAALLPGMAPGQYGHIHSASVVEVVSSTEMVVTDIWLVDAQEVANQKKDDQLTGDRMFRIAVEESNRIEQQMRNQSNTSGTNSNSRPRNTKPAITMDQINKELEARYRQRTKAVDTQTKWKGQRVRLMGFPTLGMQPGQRWNFRGGMGPQLVFIIDPAAQFQPKASARTLAASRAVNPTLMAVNGELFRQPWKEDRFAKLLAERDLDGPQFVTMVREQFKAAPSDAHAGIIGQLENIRAKKLAAERKIAAEAEAKAAAEAAAAKKSASRPAKTTDGSAPAAGEKKPSAFELKYGRKSTEPAGKPAATEKKPQGDTAK